MEVTLEKIELVKDRTGVSYKDAKDALEASDGSVVDAIITIEDTIEKRAGINTEAAGEKLSAVSENIRELIKKGNVSKIVIKKDGEVYLNIPITVGVIGTVIAPIPVVIAAITTLGFKCEVEVVKDDGTIVDVSQRINDSRNTAVEKGSEAYDSLKSKGQETYHKVKEKVSDVDFSGLKSKGSDIIGQGVDKAKDVAGAAKEKLSRDSEDDDFKINIAEDFEQATDVIEEEVAEELKN